jgi:hypothetical protein
MRIISNFKDFYDYGMAFGVDTTEVFERITDTVYIDVARNQDFAVLDVVDVVRHFNHKHDSGDNRLKKQNPPMKVYLIFFCGKVYFSFEDLTKKDHFYSIDELNKRLEEYGSNPTKRFNNIDIKSFEKSLEKVAMDQQIAYFITDFKRDYGIESYKKGIGMNSKIEVPIVKYPVLKDFGFQNIMEPHIAFQTLENYLFTTLKVNEKGMVEISDKDKAIAKGHGDKYSFKKTPQK